MRKPVTIEEACVKPFILYEASTHGQDPTRIQLDARAQAVGLRIRPQIEVEAVETALELATRGIANTYVAQVMANQMPASLHKTSFEPPLIDTFALITRSGARLSAPIAGLVDQFTSHLTKLAKKS